MDVSEAAARFLTLSEEAEVLVALYDPADCLRRANRAFREAFAVGPDEQPVWADLMRRNFGTRHGTVISSTDIESWLVSTLSRRGKRRFRAFETDLADGRWFWMTESVDRDGWMLCIATDITQLRVDERSLRQDRDQALKASQTDELTGIANRRFMIAQLEALVVRCTAESAAHGSACILDIDFFKLINDVHGHQVGDSVLLDFARRLEPFLRRHDSFGRIGGEEFMLILPNTSLHDAAAVVGRILDMVRQARPQVGGVSFSYTCSAGIAAFSPGDTAQTLYARTDAALYAAKRAGRDRVEVGLP
ncbi:GGDEF domain-containing protein [Teichococcus aerophilus]|uniref:GGDEF domain-containing protein n=1 Tax=Teichococcus aerophilus TaxID=1224513 RepID=UPI0034637FB9